MNIFLLATGVTEYTSTLPNRLMASETLYFSTPPQVPRISEYMTMTEHRWRVFSGGGYLGVGPILLDVLNDDVRMDAVIFLPHFYMTESFDMVTAASYSDHYEANCLASLYSLISLVEHDRLKPGAKICLLPRDVEKTSSTVAYHASLHALYSCLAGLKDTVDLFSTIQYKTFYPPSDPKPEVADQYVEDIAKFLHVPNPASLASPEDSFYE